MTDEEKAFRLTVLTGMFETYGQPFSDDRLRSYGNLTKHVPHAVFRAAVETSMVENTSGFPPSPGAIIACALKLAPGQRSPSHGTSLPRWYRAAIGENRRRELPQEAGSNHLRILGGEDA